MIYLDNAATTKPYQEVVDIYLKYAENSYFNPSSLYKASKDSAFLIEEIKKNILNILNLKNKNIIFTSSATEANNLAILGYLMNKKGKKYNVITSKIEHKSVLNVFKKLEEEGFEVRYVNINENQEIDIEDFKSKIDSKTIFVSLMTVNNELGTIFNIEEIAKICSEKNIVFHSDAAQALFKCDKNLISYPNMVTICSHKIHGLKSIAALIYDKNINISPIMYGGGQEHGLRSSTQDLPLIASFYKCIELNSRNYNENLKKVNEIYDYAFNKLSNLDYVEINSNPDKSTKFILNFFLKKGKSSVVLEGLSRAGIYLSTTSACNSKGEPVSYVIEEIFKDTKRAANSMRISFDEFTTKEDIDILIEKMTEIVSTKLWSLK